MRCYPDGIPNGRADRDADRGDRDAKFEPDASSSVADGRHVAAGHDRVPVPAALETDANTAPELDTSVR